MLLGVAYWNNRAIECSGPSRIYYRGFSQFKMEAECQLVEQLFSTVLDVLHQPECRFQPIPVRIPILSRRADLIGHNPVRVASVVRRGYVGQSPLYTRQST